MSAPTLGDLVNLAAKMTVIALKISRDPGATVAAGHEALLESAKEWATKVEGRTLAPSEATELPHSFRRAIKREFENKD